MAFRQYLIEPDIDTESRWKNFEHLLDGHLGFKLNDNIVEMINENNRQRRFQLFREYYILTILRLGPEYFPHDQPRNSPAMINRCFFPVPVEPVDPVDMKQARAIDAEFFMAFVQKVIFPNKIDARMENFEKYYSRTENEQIELVLEMVIGEDDLGKRIKAYLVYVLQVPENTKDLDILVKSEVELSTSDPVAASQMVMSSYRISKIEPDHNAHNVNKFKSTRPADLNLYSIHPKTYSRNYIVALNKYFRSVGLTKLNGLMKLVAK